MELPSFVALKHDLDQSGGYPFLDNWWRQWKWPLGSTKKNQYLHCLCSLDVLAPCIYPMSLRLMVKCQQRNAWYKTTMATFALELRNVPWNCCRRLCWRYPWSGIAFDDTNFRFVMNFLLYPKKIPSETKINLPVDCAKKYHMPIV